MADLIKLERNFFKFGTFKPSLVQRVKSLLTKANPIFNNTELRWIPYSFLINDCNRKAYIKEGWNKNVTLYSIVRKIAKTCSYAPWGAYKVRSEESFKQYKALSSQHQTATSLKNLQIIKRKALEPVNDARLNDLLANPNPLMSGSEYTEGLFTYKLLTGNAYEYAYLLEAGNNAGMPQQLWLLPPQYTEIKVSDTFPVMPVGYVLTEGGPIDFSLEEVNHIKYFNPNYSYIGQHLYGFSPLQAAWIANQQDNDAREAAIEILQNRGARKIITSENLTPTNAKEQAGRLKERFRQEMVENKGGFILMPGKGGILDVGLGIEDLKILEISNYTQDDLCNAYGVWSGLFNSGANQKYDNVEQFRKDFIINTILPELNQLRDSRNQKLQTDWGYKNKGIVLDYDSTVYVELQSDLKELATWLKLADWFTPNEKRVYMNENESDIPEMNMVYMDSNKMPITELGMSVAELPNTGLDDE